MQFCINGLIVGFLKSYYHKIYKRPGLARASTRFRPPSLAPPEGRIGGRELEGGFSQEKADWCR